MMYYEATTEHLNKKFCPCQSLSGITDHMGTKRSQMWYSDGNLCYSGIDHLWYSTWIFHIHKPNQIGSHISIENSHLNKWRPCVGSTWRTQLTQSSRERRALASAGFLDLLLRLSSMTISLIAHTRMRTSVRWWPGMGGASRILTWAEQLWNEDWRGPRRISISELILILGLCMISYTDLQSGESGCRQWLGNKAKLILSHGNKCTRVQCILYTEI